MNSIWSSNSLLSRIYDYGYTLLLLTPYTLLFEPYPVIYACKNNNYLLLWSLLFLGKSPNSIDQKGIILYFYIVFFFFFMFKKKKKIMLIIKIIK